VIDLQTERIITLNEARKLPWLRGRGGNSLSLDSLHRWRQHGLRGVVLESIRLGGTVVTSVEAVTRFVARLNGEGAVAPSAIGDANHPTRKADARLDRAGI
jgi:hypothetical protein